MLKISCSGGCNLGENGSLDAFIHLKELGYDAVDYQPFCTEPTAGIFTWDDKRFEEFLLMDKANAEKVGLEIFQTHGVWPFDDTKKEQWQSKFDATVKSIKGSAIVGAQYVVIHPVMPCGWNDSPHHAEDVRENIDYMRKLIPYAKEYGVKIALENMPCGRVPCSTVTELIECIDAVDSEYLVACLDTGHCITAEPDLGEMTRKLGDRLKCLHIHDNDGIRDLHEMPYFGVADWEDFIKALRDIGYKGVMNLETKPPHKIPSGLYEEEERWLKNVITHFAREVEK